MSLYVAGGGAGVASGAVGATHGTNASLFVTPNVANQMALVTVQARLNQPVTTADGVLNDNGFGFNQTMKVGPNAGISIPISNQGAAGNYLMAYQYVTIVVDTT